MERGKDQEEDIAPEISIINSVTGLHYRKTLAFQHKIK
jgi:hypothetical protein